MKLRYTSARLIAASSHGFGMLSADRDCMEPDRSKSDKEDIDIALELLLLAPVLIEALKHWKCTGCGGKGVYQQNARSRASKEERGVATDPKHEPGPVRCRVCDGQRIHPAAQLALASLTAKELAS